MSTLDSLAQRTKRGIGVVNSSCFYLLAIKTKQKLELQYHWLTLYPIEMFRVCWQPTSYHLCNYMS